MSSSEKYARRAVPQSYNLDDPVGSATADNDSTSAVTYLVGISAKGNAESAREAKVGNLYQISSVFCGTSERRATHFEVPRLVDEQVLRFQITVKDAARVEVR